MSQGVGTQNTTQCESTGGCTFTVDRAGDNSPALCNALSHLMTAPPHEIIDNPDAHSGSSPQDCEWPPMMIMNGDPEVAGAGERASLSPVRHDNSERSGEAVSKEVAHMVRSCRKGLQPGAPPPMLTRALPTGLSSEEKKVSLSGGEEGMGCWLTGGIGGSLPHATLTPSEDAEEVGTGARHRDPGESAHSPTPTASGYNTSDDAHSQTEQNRGGLSLELQQLFATGAAARAQQKDGGSGKGGGGIAAVTESDNTSGRDSGGAAAKCGVKTPAKDSGVLMEAANGMNSSRPTKRKTPATASSRCPASAPSPTTADVPRGLLAAPQERFHETSIAAAGSFVDRSRFVSHPTSAGNAGQADEPNGCELNGVSPAPNRSVNKKKDNEGTTLSGVVADETNSDAGGRTRPVTPQRRLLSGTVKSASPIFPIDASHDLAQSGGNNPGRSSATAPALTSQQQQQCTVLAQNTQKLMSPAIGASQWPFLSAPDFVSSLQIYVNTCLGLRESDMQARHSFITRVQHIVTKVLGPRAEVRVHGSITTDLALASSDIDLLVVGYEPFTPLQAIQQLSRAILHISEHELQQLESGEAGVGVAGGGSSQMCDDASLGGAAGGALDEKLATCSSVAELEDVTLEPVGELDAGDPITRMEEEEAEYRSQIERDYLLSTRAGLTSAAMVNSLPSHGSKTAAMALQGYMAPFSAAALQPPLLRSLVGEDGIAAELSMPTHHQPNAGGHRLYVPTLGGPCFQVQTIISTRVPVIKVTEKVTGMRGDITFAGGEHWRSMQLTNYLLKRYPASRGLILFLKHCVRQMGMGDSQPGGVTSFAIYLMVLHFFNEISRHLERLLNQQQQQQQNREDRTNVSTRSGNEGTTGTPGGSGDGVTGGVNVSEASATTPGTPTPLASRAAAAASVPASQQRSHFDDRFSLVEMMLLQRVQPYQLGKDGQQNTASILHYIRAFLDEEEMPVNCEDGDKDRAADLIKERTGAKLVAPLDYNAMSGESTSRGRVQQNADVVLATSETVEAPGFTSEKGDNDANNDDNNGSDNHKVAAEAAHMVDGGNPDDVGNGGPREKEGDEAEDMDDGKTSQFRSVVLRLLSTSSLGHLFHDFCFYYGFTFDYDNHGLYFDPRGNSSVVPKPRKCQQRGQHLYMTSPFDDQYDITARMLHTREFQELCRMFVPLTTPLATISGYGGGGCTLQEVLEWISPETAFGELMQVHAAIQQQQQQRVDALGTHLSKAEEQALPPPALSEGGRGASLAQQSLRYEVEKKEKKSSSPHSTFTSVAEENPPKDTRPTRRRDMTSQKTSSSATSNEPRKKDDRAAMESPSDGPSAAASLTPSSGGAIPTQPGGKTVPTEPGGAETTRGRPARTSSTQRQMRRREGGAEDPVVGGSGASAATMSPSQPVLPASPVLPETAMRPLTPAGTPVASGSITGSGVPVGGNVGSVGGEAVYARAQHSRPNLMHHQHQQLPFSFPPPIHMFLIPPNGAGAGYPDPSQLYFPMPYPPEAMLHYHHHHHHHQHHHHYQNHHYMLPFPYLGYEMNQFYQQSAVFDALNAAAVGGGGGGGGGGGPANSRQGNARGGGISPSGGRQRARGGAHRGSNGDSSIPGERVAPGRPAPLAVSEEPAAATEGVAVDSSNNNNNNNNAAKNTMTMAVSEGSSTRERQPSTTDVKERLQSDDSSSLAHEVQQHQQFLQHQQQQLQQLHQFSLSHQYHPQQNGLKLRNSGQQQQQQALWRHHHHASLMMQHQMYALQSTVDNSVSTALCASMQGGAVFRQQQQQQQQQNPSGPAYPVVAAASGLSRMPPHDIPTYNSAGPVANENQQQREQTVPAPRRPEGATTATNSSSSSGSSSASRNARGGSAVRSLPRTQGEDVGEGKVAE